MKEQVIIDDAKKHFYTDEIPEDVYIEQAFLHVGIFLGWIIDRELYSEMFKEECETQIFRFKQRDTCCIILGELWDGLIFQNQFTQPEGSDFTDYYYKSGMYLADFKQVLASNLPSIFYVEDSWENYRLMAGKIDERFEEWKKMRSEKEEIENTLKQIPKPNRKD